MKFSVTTREGITQEIEGRDGLSIMQNIRNAGIEELQAICGGCLSCATCHVYVDEAPGPAALGGRSRDEQDLLEASDFVNPTSRLSCQLLFTADLEGIQVTIAPED
jgi:2Fe-2S ferredoxin